MIGNFEAVNKPVYKISVLVLIVIQLIVLIEPILTLAGLKNNYFKKHYRVLASIATINVGLIYYHSQYK